MVIGQKPNSFGTVTVAFATTDAAMAGKTWAFNNGTAEDLVVGSQGTGTLKIEKRVGLHHPSIGP